MRQPEIIPYKGTNILYLNFENLKKQESIIQLETAGKEYICRQNINSVLVLSNMHNMLVNHEIRNHFIDVAKANAPFVKASVVVGMNGMISYMFDDFLKKTGRNIKAFKTSKEALRYLASFSQRPIYPSRNKLI